MWDMKGQGAGSPTLGKARTAKRALCLMLFGCLLLSMSGAAYAEEIKQPFGIVSQGAPDNTYQPYDPENTQHMLDRLAALPTGQPCKPDGSPPYSLTLRQPQDTQYSDATVVATVLDFWGAVPDLGELERDFDEVRGGCERAIGTGEVCRWRKLYPWHVCDSTYLSEQSALYDSSGERILTLPTAEIIRDALNRYTDGFYATSRVETQAQLTTKLAYVQSCERPYPLIALVRAGLLTRYCGSLADAERYVCISGYDSSAQTVTIADCGMDGRYYGAYTETLSALISAMAPVRGSNLIW